MMTTEQVWEGFSGQLKQFILRRVGDEYNAEDILQDVFVKVHTHIDTLRDEERLPAWIYQITRNAITDYYRMHSATMELADTQDTHDIPALEEDSLDDVVRELIPCIRGMVNSLPEHYRQAIILTEYQGVTQKELGEQLGLSFSGAKSRVQRAREKLKHMLLDCCHFEFDHFGKVIDYQPHCQCCADCT